ncbi:hypothetical protein [Streptomyces beihaiensis]|uniref:Uncharacterized protein n=1 Tax=Streptomyces beihaiensis TaxID=2984495 RepID=A0ABT3U0R9_9ACTN|nr:hypothetical protein [Streptomyces beihaiensis]MCX3062913.1 hypothetical protein [Streptomyces beihaiensis]
MRVDIAWWDLDGSPQTIDTLRELLRDGTVDEWSHVPGLRLKFWMADRDRNRWGAVMLWQAERPATLPPNRAAQLIGRPPTHRACFEVEATAEGAHTLPQLRCLGAVFAEQESTTASTRGDRTQCTNT